jgi:putative transposase
MKALGIRLEFIFVNTPEQKCHIESFQKTLKREYIWINDFKDYQEAEVAITDAFQDYNKRRPHSSLGFKTPMEFFYDWELMQRI